MKKKLFAILLALAILLSSMLSLSEVSFAQEKNYVLSETGGNVLKETDNANDLISYMNTPGNFNQTKSYTLTLNDNLEIPVEGGHLKTLEIHCNLTIEGNNKTITGAAGGQDKDRLINIKLEKGDITINNLKVDGSNKYAGILWLNNNPDGKFNINLNFCHFENCYAGDDRFEYGGAIYFKFDESPDAISGDKIITKANIKNSSFNNCKAGQGGAIYLRGRIWMTIIDTQMSNSYAEYRGGAVGAYNVRKLEFKSPNLGTKPSITNSKANKYNGGAIYIYTFLTHAYYNEYKTDLLISDYTIDKCSAGDSGVAISASYVNIDFDKLSISNCYNSGVYAEGALYISSSGGSIKNSKIFNNDLGQNNMGSAISIYFTDTDEVKKIEIVASEFYNNKSGAGGAIYIRGGDVEIKDGIIDGVKKKSKLFNNEAQVGGAICLSHGKLTIKNTEIKNNRVIFDNGVDLSGNGAAIYSKGIAYDADELRELTISEDCIISENHADKFGGGIYSEDSTVNIDKSAIEKNKALKGAGLYLVGGSAEIKNESVIKENEANEANPSADKKVGDGAGLYILPGDDSQYKIDNSKIINNKAGALGGGIYLLGVFYDMAAEYDPNIIKYKTDIYNYLKGMSHYIKLNKATFEGNTAGLGFYNPPKDIESIKNAPDAVSDDDYKALMSEKNSCRNKLMIEGADGKMKHVESLINNYDIDYADPKINISYNSNGKTQEEKVYTEETNFDNNNNVIKPFEHTIKTLDETGLKKEGSKFLGWNTKADGTGKPYEVGKKYELNGNLYLYAIWEGAPAPAPSTLILTLDENYAHGKITDYEVMQGEFIEPYLYTPRRRGYIFEGWSYNRDRMREVRKGDQVYGDTVLYAMWTKRKAKAKEEAPEEPEEIKGMTHKAYIFGYPDGTVRPNGKITRAEAAAMLARLLDIEAYGSADAPSFPDTPSSWYNKAINAVVQRGIMQGYPDGTFRPNSPITRAEFTKMIAVIDNKPYGTAPFADVIGHWAERPIGAEHEAKRITGYPDGTFRPDNHITRCEAAVILNKIFERNFDAMSLIKCKNPQMIKYFTDLDASFWGYNDMVEATNDHEYIRRTKNRVEENWLLIK